MKKEHSIYYGFLIFFGLLVLVSLFFVFTPKKRWDLKFKLGTSYRPGIFQIVADKEVSANSPFSIKFVADSDDQAVNAVALEIEFDPDRLEILNVNTSQSFCQFYPENKFNNAQGTISIHCGAPHPGFRGEDIIANVKFLAKIVGQTKIEITEKSMILLDDGKGTNIFSKPVVKTISVVNHI
jgi:cohesin domain-containing protein